MADPNNSIMIDQIPSVVNTSIPKIDALRDTYVTTAAESFKKVQDLNNGFTAMVAETSKVVDQNYQNINDALQKAQKIDQYPPIVGNVLGFFDKDWNEQVQKGRISQSQIAVQQAGAKLENAKLAREVGIQSVKQGVDTVGLMLDAETKKLSQAAQIQGLAASQDKIEFDRKQILLNNSNPQALQKAVKDGTITEEQARQEIQRRTNANNSAANLALAVKANDFQLQNSIRSQFLNEQLSTQDLRDLADKAEKDGGVTSITTRNGPVKFTAQEIKTALAGASERDTKQRDQSASRAVAVAESAVVENETMSMTQRLTAQQGYLTPEQEAIIQKSNIGFKAALANGSPAKAVEIMNNANAAIKKQIEDKVKAAPKEQQDAMRQYFYNNGNIDPAASAEFMSTYGMNPNWADGTRMEASARLFSNELLKVYSQNTMEMTKDTNGNMVMSDSSALKKNSAAAIAQAARAKGVDGKGQPILDVYKAKNFADYTEQSLVDMAVAAAKTGGSNNPFASVVQLDYDASGNPTGSGRIKNSFYAVDADGKASFSPVKLAGELTLVTMRMQEAGLLKTDQDLTAMVLERLRSPQAQTSYTARVQESYTIPQRAFSQILVGGKEHSAFNHWIGEMEKAQKATVLDVSQAKRDTAIMAAAGGVPQPDGSILVRPMEDPNDPNSAAGAEKQRATLAKKVGGGLMEMLNKLIPSDPVSLK